MPISPSRSRVALPLLLTFIFSAYLQAAPSQSDFLRLIDKGATGSRLETADVAYRNAEGVTVHLVSAVHVGERDYFTGLNESFKLRDCVLYEMVKPKDALVPAPGEKVESDSTVSQVQRMMKDMLGLEFQLDLIDYTAANFVHADLDAETFQKMQNERGESMQMLMLQAFMKSMSQPDPAGADAIDPMQDPMQEMDKTLEDLIKLLTRPDMERQLKLRFARQLADIENSAFSPDALSGTVLLTERNKAAIKALETALKDGKKDVAVFYGAAHMPDLAERLTTMGFKPVATQWRLAWDLTIRPDEPSAIEKALMEMLKGLEEEDTPDQRDR